MCMGKKKKKKKKVWSITNLMLAFNIAGGVVLSQRGICAMSSFSGAAVLS